MRTRIPLAILATATVTGLAIVTGCQNNDTPATPASTSGPATSAAAGGMATGAPAGGAGIGSPVAGQTSKPGAPALVNHPHLGGAAGGGIATSAPH